MSDSHLTENLNTSVAAVIVVYNAYQSLTMLLQSLSGQVDTIIIIDNSDEGYKVPEAVINMSTVKYQRLAFNKGLGVGINQGIALSKEIGAEWVLLLDQDSVVSDGMVASMLIGYQKNSDLTAIAMICPDVFLTDKGVHQYPLSFNSVMTRKITSTSDEVDFAITSGGLIKLSLLEAVGLMDEAFFIDYIDFDFCLRLRSCHYKILFVKEARLLHKLGDQKVSKIGLLYTFHTPQRLYFQTRNRLSVIKRYGLAFPSFTLMQLSLFVLKFVKILVVEDQKVTRLRCYFAGVRDFLLERPHVD